MYVLSMTYIKSNRQLYINYHNLSISVCIHVHIRHIQYEYFCWKPLLYVYERPEKKLKSVNLKTFWEYNTQTKVIKAENNKLLFTSLSFLKLFSIRFLQIKCIYLSINEAPYLNTGKKKCFFLIKIVEPFQPCKNSAFCLEVFNMKTKFQLFVQKTGG